MKIRQYRPTSPGRRKASVLLKLELTKKPPEKSLIEPKKKTGGRNANGRITTRHHGGGAKRKYRIVDFKRKKDDVPARVVALEYDPNRSANIALLQYADGEKSYMLRPKDLKVGSTVISGEKVEPRVGNCMPLSSIPLGMIIHNVEIHPGRGGQLARSAGSYVQLAAKEGKFAILNLPSGEMRKVNISCRATLGQVGNLDHQNIRIGKAGRKRHMGIRPTVRGSAMNPVAHPMGGGEGRRSGGRHPVSKWGKPSKGGKTLKRNNPTDTYILRRRKKKK